jgi:16S rRNA (guanine527-N7)-methyltransferase
MVAKATSLRKDRYYMFDNFSELWAQTLNWQPTPAQAQLFAKLYDLVLEGNQTQNLTRITEPSDFWEKHLWDSLRGVRLVWELSDLQVIDIGTGAGFPGLPVAIAQPNWQISLLDSKIKKTNFIKNTIEALELAAVSVFTGRAEEINQTASHYQKYDLALLRAVGNVTLCTKYVMPFLKVGGQAVLYRGQWTDTEQLELEEICKELHAEVADLESFTTPLTDSQRRCVYITKLK